MTDSAVLRFHSSLECSKNSSTFVSEHTGGHAHGYSGLSWSWAGVPVLCLASDRGSLCSDVSVSFPLLDKCLRKSVYEERRLIWFTL